METSKYIRFQIKELEKQRKQNETYGDEEEKIYKSEIKNINNKIRKTNLKATKEAFLKLKKEIKADYIYSNHIGYKCEVSIRNNLSRLYDQLNDLDDDQK